MKPQRYDAIIVGTGVAGLFAGLCLPKHLKVLMITKDEIENSDSYLAQGGISTLKAPDDFENYYEDTMRAGHYENNPDSVRIMIESSHQIIDDLIHYGVEFDKDEEGNLAYTREAAHSTFRILHHDDLTGKEIMIKLIDNVEKRKNIEVRKFTTMMDLLQKDNICCGIVARDKDGVVSSIYAKTVILATGGIGGLFKNSTNFRHICGDSFGMALAHGVEMENLNYIQIHPTTLYSKKEGRKFLISESVRGEGAVLLNEDHRRFVNELLPRDTVTNEIKKEMERQGTDHVYLTMKHMTREQVEKRFPNIFKRCLEEGYDLSKDYVPVTPAQHYIMGGIKATVNGETSMKNLYAVGETACNGVHGANRLASNSLLESLVFSKRAAHVIEETIADIKELEVTVDLDKYSDMDQWKKANRKRIMDEIKRKDEKFYAKWCDNEA
nr:L-aspartate oxidase [uncultured Lachnoclostridium sp.]